VIATDARPVLDDDAVRAFFSRHRGASRAGVVAAGLLHPDAPDAGTAMLTAAHRTPAGQRLLDQVKATLATLLYGSGAGSLRVAVDHHELLTLVLPHSKATAVSFLQAATVTHATGTWRDPAGVHDDTRADNVVIEVQYGETSDEMVGHAVMVAIRLLNVLEINEQVLYARSIDIDDSTLLL
jgi:hypothetical protein